MALLVCAGHAWSGTEVGVAPRGKVSRLIYPLLTIGSGVLFVGSLYWNSAAMLAYQALPGPVSWDRETPRPEVEVLHARALRASRIMPLHSYYHFAVADTAALLGRDSTRCGEAAKVR